MARPWIKRIATVAALALLWAIWRLWSRLAPPLDAQMILAVTIVAAALLAAIWWLWWRLPEWQAARLRLWEKPPPRRRSHVRTRFNRKALQRVDAT
jgi:hypothetical protein